MSHQEPSCAQHRKAESAPKGSVETVGEEGAIGKKEDIAVLNPLRRYAPTQNFKSMSHQGPAKALRIEDGERDLDTSGEGELDAGGNVKGRESSGESGKRAKVAGGTDKKEGLDAAEAQVKAVEGAEEQKGSEKGGENSKVNLEEVDSGMEQETGSDKDESESESGGNEDVVKARGKALFTAVEAAWEDSEDDD
ncbi:hypothetical protein B0A50_00495 [Salinomyces thailandicus]|uniref:Uncharacterized protein n=1 Tax=Salinomyces thailandicus TaxID=706561 RepID=A0A4V5N8E8_9PEZI|nr:hypothetical protein B0A50_00495 [Salinomyces thailandica]